MDCYIDYNYGNPTTVYICRNCGYRPADKFYTASHTTPIKSTIGDSMTLNSTQTKYELYNK